MPDCTGRSSRVPMMMMMMMAMAMAMANIKRCVRPTVQQHSFEALRHHWEGAPHSTISGRGGHSINQSINQSTNLLTNRHRWARRSLSWRTMRRAHRAGAAAGPSGTGRESGAFGCARWVRDRTTNKGLHHTTYNFQRSQGDFPPYVRRLSGDRRPRRRRGSLCVAEYPCLGFRTDLITNPKPPAGPLLMLCRKRPRFFTYSWRRAKAGGSAAAVAGWMT
jgi:hypothetical protein